MIKLSRQEKARQLHDNAMAAAEKAFFAKRAGDIDLAKTLIYEAYKNEKSAAESLSTQIDKEPSRSVLFRSAATLAYECGEYREAEKLISNGLFGNPPDEIANELRDLLEQVNFTRHLQNQNITLLEDEIQMSFVGNDIGKGFAPFNIFLSRMKDFERIIQRFRDRISKVPFKEQPKSISSGKNCCLYLSVPREGSFSVTLRLTSQMELPNISISKGERIMSDRNEVLHEIRTEPHAGKSRGII